MCEDKPLYKPACPEPVRGVARRVRSEDLLGPPGELLIEHRGREYRLRRTREGKLILTA